MVQKAIKYGNSLAIVLPKEFTQEQGVEAGTLLETTVKDGRVTVCPVEVVPKLSSKDEGFVDRLYEKRKKVFDALAE